MCRCDAGAPECSGCSAGPAHADEQKGVEKTFRCKLWKTYKVTARQQFDRDLAT